MTERFGIRRFFKDRAITRFHESLTPEQERMAWFFRNLGQVAYVGGLRGGYNPESGTHSGGLTVSLSDIVDTPLLDSQLGAELAWDFNSLRSRLEMTDEDVLASISVANHKHYDPVRYSEIKQVN